ERLVEVFVQDRDGVVDRHATQAERGGYRTGQIGRSRAAPDWRRRGTNRCGARGPPRTTRFASLLITRSTLRIELVRGPQRRQADFHPHGARLDFYLVARVGDC